MHAVIYAYIWSRSQSLAVAAAYHSACDEIRDTMERTTGLVPVTEVRTNLWISTTGTILLVKADWENLPPKKANSSEAKPIEHNSAGA